MTRKAVVLLLLPVLSAWPVRQVMPAGGKPPPGSRGSSLSRQATRPDPALRVSPDTLLRRLNAGQEILLIDVREGAGFRQLAIPGSMSIPLFALKTKTFLKSKPLVLINEGYNSGPLEQECRALRDAGFDKVSILAGGLAAWLEQGGPLRGDVFARRELNRVSPRDFFNEKDAAHRLVVDVSEAETADSRALIPQAVRVPYRGSARDFLGPFRQALHRHGGGLSASVLICNRNGEYPESMENLIREASPATVFYLRGGLDSYREFRQHQALIRQAAESRKIVKRCVNCP